MSTTTLNAAQLAAVHSTADLLRVDAGPGAGKTEVLAARIAHMVASGRFRAGQIVALTFTRSMAQDLRRRITARLPADGPCPACKGQGTFQPAHEGATGFDCGECAGSGRVSIGAASIGTLHGLAAGWIRQALRGELAGGEAVKGLGFCRTVDFGIATPEDVDDRLAFAQTSIGVKKITQRALREGLRLTGTALTSWPPEAEGRRQLRLHDLVTYDDLLVMLQAMVGAPAAPGRPHLRDRFPCLFVDERQDLSARHWRIVGAWAPASLTYVGDDAQAIYGFLGRKDGDAADAALAALAAIEGPPGGSPPAYATSDRVALGENYRSGPELVRAARGVRNALADMGACTRMDLTCANPDRVSRAMIGPLDVIDVVTECVNDGSGVLGQIAVLASTHAELDEAAVLLDEAGVPWAKLERGKAVWSTELGRVVVAMARANDCRHWTRYDAAIVLRALGLQAGDIIDVAETRAFQGGTMAEGLDWACSEGACAPGLRQRPPAGWFNAVVSAPPNMHMVAALVRDLDAGGDGWRRLGPGIDRVLDALDEWTPTGKVTPPADFAVWLASPDAGNQFRADPGDLLLSTIHGAKGLEWENVVVLGACEGSMPPAWAKTDADRNEWGRALYVAMTRARRALYVITPTELRGKPRGPAPLLVAGGLVPRPSEPALVESTQPGGRTDTAEQVNLLTGVVERPPVPRTEILTGSQLLAWTREERGRFDDDDGGPSRGDFGDR